MLDFSQIKEFHIGMKEVDELYVNGNRVWGRQSEFAGLTFTARQANSTIKMVKVGSSVPTVSLQYSTDGGSNWNTFTVGTTTVTLPNVGDKVCFKATTTNKRFANAYASNYNNFVMTGQFDASGNINSLLNGEDMDSLTSLSSNSFACLFDSCASLVDASGMKLKATSDSGGLAYANLFYGCGNLEKSPEISLTETHNGANGTCLYMFSNCTSLTSVDMTDLTSIGSNGLRYAFQGCTSLTSVDLSNVTSVGYNGLSYAFQNCTSITSIDLSSVVSATGSQEFDYAFQGCTSLRTVDLSKLSYISGKYGLRYAFYGCTSLRTVYLTKLSSVGNYGLDSVFSGCTHLELVDFSQATAVPALNNTNAFQNTNNTFKIVVPDSLYDSWIVATNWSTYASHIVKASEYTPAS